MNEKEVLVIKYGSASVTDDHGMDLGRLSRHASQIAALSEQYQIIIVSSGSVAVGRALWRQIHSAADYPDAQTLAMLGSAESVVAWQRALRAGSLVASQLLVTHREINEAAKQNSLIKALRANLAQGVIPIINENDALSESELAKLSYGGDNDGLGSHIAVVMRARKLLLLTEAPGVLDGETIVGEVSFQDAKHTWLKSLANGGNGKGRGGMRSKIEAAIAAAEAGIDAYIGSADQEIALILAAKNGTHFLSNPKVTM